MTSNPLGLVIFFSYLILTIGIGLWQTRRVKNANDYVSPKMSAWKAGTFLAGFSMGGGATYGLAGDTVKFGMTYLVWFPISIMTGWWVTGWLFGRYYHRHNGITLPTLLKQRFGKRTRIISSLSTMLYAVFLIVIETYMLATIVCSLVPHMSLPQATLIALTVGIASVALSGTKGSSATNLLHSGMIFLTFGAAMIALCNAVGGWNQAIERVLAILPDVAHPGVDSGTWLTVTGLGWGVIGQLWLGKGGRLGGISVTSTLAASCRSEKDVSKAFLLAGIFAGIPSFLAGMLGIFTAAQLGPRMAELPSYSSIGLAVAEISPALAGLLLAAIAAAILSTFGPTTILFSSVFIEDLVKPIFRLSEQKERLLYPVTIIVISLLSGAYVATAEITDILPFMYKTAMPCTVPLTVVALFGMRSARVANRHAFWAIALGVPVALIWGMVLNDPFGIKNIYIALIVPLFILTMGAILGDQPKESAIKISKHAPRAIKS
jgi:SSS family solute:Na+ symporter